MALLNCSGDSPSQPEPPQLPEPSVEVSPLVGDAPLSGSVALRSQPGAEGWAYEVDLDGDGDTDREGILGELSLFRYLFVEPGSHVIRWRLTGPERAVSGEQTVIAEGIEPLVVLAARWIGPETQDPGAFEGLVADPAGDALYAGNYSRGELYRLSTVDLEELGPSIQVDPGPEGLAVIEPERVLVALHKHGPLTVVGLPGFDVLRVLDFHGFIVRAAGDSRALLTDDISRLRLIDIWNGESLAEAHVEGGPRHFAISPEEDEVALLTVSGDPRLHWLGFPGLDPRGVVPLPELESADIVAYDPTGGSVYVFGRANGEGRFLALDRASGAVVQTAGTGPGACGLYCVANPVATSSSGRYVAFEQGARAVIVDTATDMPRFELGIPGFSNMGFSVTDSPSEPDVFFFLRSDGLLIKVRVGS